MVKLPTAAKSATPRIGRPPAELAGEVEQRILDAAATVFLARGFDGASIEQIAETARSGKPSIYARFSSKDDLFEAAIKRKIRLRNERLEACQPSGTTVEDRLISIGEAVVRESLKDDSVQLARLGVGEARRSPSLVGRLMREARGRCGLLAARFLVDSLPELGFKDENDPRALKAGRFFDEVVHEPLMLRAIAGEVATLQSDLRSHVRERVIFFLAALRNGGLDG